MAQRCKQMRVGARAGFACHSVKLVLLANGNRYEVDSNTSFRSGKALYPFKILPCPNFDPFLTHIRICSLCSDQWCEWNIWNKVSVVGTPNWSSWQNSHIRTRHPYREPINQIKPHERSRRAWRPHSCSIPVFFCGLMGPRVSVG
jgi:hypothetical protein